MKYLVNLAIGVAIGMILFGCADGGGTDIPADKRTDGGNAVEATGGTGGKTPDPVGMGGSGGDGGTGGAEEAPDARVPVTEVDAGNAGPDLSPFPDVGAGAISWPGQCNPQTGQVAGSKARADGGLDTEHCPVSQGARGHCDWQCLSWKQATDPKLQISLMGAGQGVCGSALQQQKTEGGPCGTILSNFGTKTSYGCWDGMRCVVDNVAHRLTQDNGQWIEGNGVCRQYCHTSADCSSGTCEAVLPCPAGQGSYGNPPRPLEIGLCTVN